MSTSTRLDRIEQTLAGTASIRRMADTPRIVIRHGECAEAFDAFFAANGFDPGTFRDFRECLEAQRNGAAQ